MKISDVIAEIERIAPLSLQESYDNSGLIAGDTGQEVKGVLLAFDVTPDVIRDAIENKCNLVISHHPLIFKGIQKIDAADKIGQMLMRAIKDDIVLYAAHTNADNVIKGVNHYLAKAIGVKKMRILQPKKGMLRKLVIFCPMEAADQVRSAIFKAGAGHIGNYDSCSYNLEGQGSFRAGKETNPYVGEKDKLHFEKEVRIETIYPVHLERKIIKSMTEAHPYEEVAYDLYPLENYPDNVGAGMIGELDQPLHEKDFLKMCKDKLIIPCIKHSKLTGKPVKKVAFCGGAGSFLIGPAKSQQADVFLTGDIKYHDYFQSGDNLLLVDIGHYESEQFVLDMFYSILKQKFSTFAVLITKVKTNPVYYY